MMNTIVFGTPAHQYLPNYTLMQSDQVGIIPHPQLKPNEVSIATRVDNIWHLQTVVGDPSQPLIFMEVPTVPKPPSQEAP